MRELQLQSVNMSGPDVFDWQTFLKNRGVFRGTADGKFGPISDAATKAYQTNAGLASLGVVDAATMSRALTDGYVSSMGANLSGMDANIDCSPFAGRISAAGIKFVARYYSDNAAKTLSPTEAQHLSGAADIVTVFENRNNAAEFFSADFGARHAAKALALAAAASQPAGSTIYFAVDYDASPADVQGAVSDYFKAIQDAFAAAPTGYAIGVYGSGLTCRVLTEAGLARFTWLAGSIGFREFWSFRPHADIVQLAPERPLFDGHLSIDDDVAQSAEYGAFRSGRARAVTGNQP